LPRNKVDLKSVQLGEAATRYLESKRPSTKRAYEKCLKRFRVFYEGGLEGFIGEIERAVDLNENLPITERTRPGEATIRRFLEWHKEVDYSNNATRQSVSALQNALKYYGITMSFDFISLPPSIPLRENEKHRWTLDEIRQLVDTATYLRDKALIMVCFQSGLGVGDVVDLNYVDVSRGLKEEELPLMLHLYRKKTSVEHKTFLGRDSVQYLREYLKTRPNIKNGDPLFTMLGSRRRITIGAVQKQLREYARKLEFILDEDVENGYNPARPHSLRSAFRSRLTGKMDENLIEFFMGHDIGVEKKTYINMPDEELRELYANYEHFLAIDKTSKQEELEQGPIPLPEETVNRISDLEATVKTLTQELVKRDEALSVIEDTIQDILTRLDKLEMIND
jgi:integrase